MVPARINKKTAARHSTGRGSIGACAPATTLHATPATRQAVMMVSVMVTAVQRDHGSKPNAPGAGVATHAPGFPVSGRGQ